MGPPVDVVAGRYRLLTLLGSGGMGSVWRGEHVSLGTPVAVKLLDPRLAQKETTRGRFLREARSAAALRSQHVVQIIDHGVEGDFPFIVMELLGGESLAARLGRPPALTPAEVARIFVQMGRAVAKAHGAGIVHRDLKPDNVQLAAAEDPLAGLPPEEQYVVKVVDFGIAKLTDEGLLVDDISTDTGSLIGTPHYMGPEQARGVKALDSRADLWSMAIIAFECLTGVRPFRADSLGDLILQICADPPPVPSTVASVPLGFDAWFEKATQKKPDDRFQDVVELVRALEDVLTPGSHKIEARGASASISTPGTPSPDAALSQAPTVLADAERPPGPAPDAAPGADDEAHGAARPDEEIEDRADPTADPGPTDEPSVASARSSVREGRTMLRAAGLFAAVCAVAAIVFAAMR